MGRIMRSGSALVPLWVDVCNPFDTHKEVARSFRRLVSVDTLSRRTSTCTDIYKEHFEH